MTENRLPSVAEVAAEVPDVLARFRSGATFAFSFGDGRPEGVLLTYDEYEDLGGETKFRRYAEVLAPEVITAELHRMTEAIRADAFDPVAFGDGSAEAVVMSTAQYRELRGDDEPPAGVDDDPTRRTYATEPLADSRPMSVDELAALMGPEAVQDLEELRREDGER